jgi:chemotaxis protein methyltransferase CheR
VCFKVKKYPLNDRNHVRFSDLIQTRTGIRVGENRRDVLARALRESAESAECADLDRFFLCLQEARTDSEVWNDLLRKVTIGETYFFRDADYIEALRRHILPEMIARHQTDRTLRLWSAGCATGEEPYTLSIVLRQILSDIDRWKILILATDINRQALSHAAAARYRAWSFRETDAAIRSAFFIGGGETFTLDPSVRQMVTFAYLNLAEDNYPSPANQTNDLDLILCRNVTMYLPLPLIHNISNRFYQCLSDGGWLIVGPSETHLEIYRQFQTLNLHGNIIYRKVSAIDLSFRGPGVARPEPGSPSLNRLRISDASTLNGIFSAGALQPSYGRKSSATPSHHSTHGIEITGLPESESSKTKPEVHPEQGQNPSSTRPDPAGWVDLCQQGEALMRQHRYDEARQCFLVCLERNSSSPAAKQRMAWLEANAGRLDEARTWALQALEHDPLLSEVHYTLALIHEVQGELQEAVNRLKKVIYLDPNFVLAHFGLFHLYQRTGNPMQAERHRTLAVHLASKLSHDTVLPGSDDLTAGQLLAMAQAAPNHRDAGRTTTQSTATWRGKA